MNFGWRFRVARRVAEDTRAGIAAVDHLDHDGRAVFAESRAAQAILFANETQPLGIFGRLIGELDALPRFALVEQPGADRVALVLVTIDPRFIVDLVVERDTVEPGDELARFLD